MTTVTLTPAAAAARSFERTASIWRPKLDRRTLAMSRQSATITARRKKPKTGLGSLPSRPRNDESGPRLKPNSSGGGTGEAPEPPPQRRSCEPELLDRDRRRQRHDGEADAAHAERGHRHEQPEHRRDRNGDQRRERELDAEVDRHVRDGVAGHPGQRELDDRDLARRSR